MTVDLTAPPEEADVATFPQHLLPDGSVLFRIFQPWNPEDGTAQSPLYFRTLRRDASSCRYDLPAPRGTCYLAMAPAGAWLEVFRNSVLIDQADVDKRRLASIRTAESEPLADVAAPGSRGFGVTSEIHTVDDYSLPQRWAAWLDMSFDGVFGRARHDPALDEETVSLFGPAGEDGSGRLVEDARQRLEESLLDVEKFGFRVLPVPYDVVTTTPPD